MKRKIQKFSPQRGPAILFPLAPLWLSIGMYTVSCILTDAVTICILISLLVILKQRPGLTCEPNLENEILRLQNYKFLNSR